MNVCSEFEAGLAVGGRSVPILNIDAMGSTCHAIALAVATCSARQLAAADFVVSGEQEVRLVQNSITSTVQTATFVVARVGSYGTRIPHAALSRPDRMASRARNGTKAGR